MSARLIEAVVDEAHLDLGAQDVARVRDLVVAGKLEPAAPWGGREWMRQIVANAFSGVDVDKVGAGRLATVTCSQVRLLPRRRADAGVAPARRKPCKHVHTHNTNTLARAV